MIVVVGAGSSGLAVARHASSMGEKVLLYDEGDLSVVRRRAGGELPSGVELVQGLPGLEVMGEAETVVVSPGVPLSKLPVPLLEERGTEVIGEVEYAWRHLKGFFIGVTGTNGKSTVTTLVGEMLKREKERVFVGGNLSEPLTKACGGDYETFVVELSSFQLEGIRTFRPDVSVLLNVGEDHMDRYSSFEEYAEAKMRIFENQREEDAAVINADDPEVVRRTADIRPVKVMFSLSGREGAAARFTGNGFEISCRGETHFIPSSEIALAGRHNLENAMAASLAALWSGVSVESVRGVLRAFKGLPHRMEFVGSVMGVDFFNDSKGTNVHAVVRALSGIDRPVVLIAGGKDKGIDFGSLREACRGKVKAAVLIGEAAQRLEESLGGVVETLRAGDMDEAVRAAFRRADPGDVVLLSPGCSSFDMFSSFEERGEIFRDSVRRLAIAQPAD